MRKITNNELINRIRLVTWIHISTPSVATISGISLTDSSLLLLIETKASLKKFTVRSCQELSDLETPIRTLIQQYSFMTWRHWEAYSWPPTWQKRIYEFVGLLIRNNVWQKTKIDFQLSSDRSCQWTPIFGPIFIFFSLCLFQWPKNYTTEESNPNFQNNAQPYPYTPRISPFD